MDINNVTQYYHLIARTGLVDQIPNGRSLMACVDEYNFNCNCGKTTDRTAIYNRCKAIYEESVRSLGAASIALLFQRLPDLAIAFRQDTHIYLRTINR